MKINIPAPRKSVVTPAVPEPLAVNVKEAARLLAISERTIWTLAKTGRIKAKKIGGRTVFPLDSLRSFLYALDDEPAAGE